ncbi:MAG: Flp pilus assembly complex ATPase component TadA [Planctomycetes bacterium]|nr:Flp pilus assembly complex ATPase component TadA [Planctomycetota bacterium]MCB9884115.1 Flp pilus assembly complex ATPase component TadA [Planctomycetota bacterium]
MDAKRLDSLLAAMHRVGATVLHLVPGRAPCVRVQRRFVQADETVVEAQELNELTRDMLFADHRERLHRQGHVDVLYVSRNGRRYRVTVNELDGNQSLLLRPVPENPPKLEQTELPEQITSFTHFRSGLVAVAGFFGSGKSTTLAAIVDALNQNASRHIVTIEDAIEFLHPNGAALLHQREIGSHVENCAEGIRQAVAAGADTIVVSELVDAAGIDAALNAAEAGCLVFVGIEAGSVVGAMSELTLMVPFEERGRLSARLARCLRAVSAQNLLQRSHRAGRVAQVEILISNPAAREAIRLGNLRELPGIMQRCRGLGMQTADIALRDLLARHAVTADEAMLHAADRDQLTTRSRSGSSSPW